MKVVSIVPALDGGGAERVVADANRVLCEAGHSSVVVSSGGRLTEEIRACGGRHETMDVKSKNPVTAPFRALRLRALLRRERPDVVCVHSRVPAWLFAMAGRGLGIKRISYAHGASKPSRYSSIMARGDIVIVPSRFMADFLLRSYGGSTWGASLAGRIRVVPPCVDLSKFDPARVDAAFADSLRKKWGVRPGERVTMCVGRLSPVKGHDALIRDFAERVRAGAADRLVIVGGDGGRHRGYAEGLRSLAESLGVEGRVVFAGTQDRMPECLSIADEVVSANTVKPETFGISVAEAFAMERKVRLLRHFGGAAEIVEAVESSGAPTSRDAIHSLYSFERFAALTLDAYSAAASSGKAGA